MARKRRKRITCPNCDKQLKQEMNFCPNCGQENHIKRVSVSMLVSDFSSTYFSFDSKLFSSLKYLLTKPSFLSVEYLNGKIEAYLRPIRMYIFISFVILTTTSWVGILIVSMLLVTVGEMIAFPFSNAFAMDRSKKGNKGEYMALYSIAFSVAHIFSHNGGMHLIESIGYDNTWLVISALALVCMLLLFILRQQLKPKKIIA